MKTVRKLHRIGAVLVTLFNHLGCALARRMGAAPHGRPAALAVPMCVGGVLAAVLLAAFMGKLYPYAVPQAYAATYGR